MTDTPPASSDVDQVIDLPDLTLVPGLMDMEVDLVLGGPGAGLTDPVRMDPVKMGLRAVANGEAVFAWTESGSGGSLQVRTSAAKLP